MAEGHRQRLKEKAKNLPLESFKQHEIMELMLFFVLPRRDTNSLGHTLMERYGSLYNICNASGEDLMRVKGLGAQTVEFLRLIPDFVRCYENSVFSEKFVFKTVDDIGKYCLTLQLGRLYEAVYLLCLDNGRRLIKKVKVAEGLPGEVYIEPRQIIEQVTHTSTTAVILCHNHPGGSLTPSHNDLIITSKTRDALDLIGIELIDHIIIANDSWFSFKSSGVSM